MQQDGGRRARGTTAAGRARGHVAQPKRRSWGVGVVLVSVLAGLLFALSASTSAGVPLRSETADQIAAIQRARADNLALEDRIAALRADNEERTEQIGAANDEVRALQQDIRRAAPQVGFAAVRGPALQVTLDDAPRGAAIPDGFSPDDLVVHQQDVQAVVNALWRGGAEAMMLMDQRVISTSAVRCVGNTLILQGRVYSPPYVITAIGDVEGMQNALLLSPEVSIYRQFEELVGLRYDVDDDVGLLTFPRFIPEPGLEYAVSAEESSAS